MQKIIQKNWLNRIELHIDSGKRRCINLMQSQYKRNRFYKPEVFSIELNKIIITHCRNFHHMIFPALMYVRILMYIWLYVINYRSHLFQEAVASFQSRKLCLCRFFQNNKRYWIRFESTWDKRISRYLMLMRNATFSNHVEYRIKNIVF